MQAASWRFLFVSLLFVVVMVIYVLLLTKWCCALSSCIIFQLILITRHFAAIKMPPLLILLVKSSSFWYIGIGQCICYIYYGNHYISDRSLHTFSVCMYNCGILVKTIVLSHNILHFFLLFSSAAADWTLLRLCVLSRPQCPCFKSLPRKVGMKVMHLTHVGNGGDIRSSRCYLFYILSPVCHAGEYVLLLMVMVVAVVTL